MEPVEKIRYSTSIWPSLTEVYNSFDQKLSCNLGQCFLLRPIQRTTNPGQSTSSIQLTPMTKDVLKQFGPIPTSSTIQNEQTVDSDSIYNLTTTNKTRDPTSTGSIADIISSSMWPTPSINYTDPEPVSTKTTSIRPLLTNPSITPTNDHMTTIQEKTGSTWMSQEQTVEEAGVAAITNTTSRTHVLMKNITSLKPFLDMSGSDNTSYETTPLPPSGYPPTDLVTGSPFLDTSGSDNSSYETTPLRPSGYPPADLVTRSPFLDTTGSDNTSYETTLLPSVHPPANLVTSVHCLVYKIMIGITGLMICPLLVVIIILIKKRRKSQRYDFPIEMNEL